VSGLLTATLAAASHVRRLAGTLDVPLGGVCRGPAQGSGGVSDRVAEVDHAVVESSVFQQLEVESEHAARRRAFIDELARILALPDVLDLRGLHSHIGSQIFDTDGFEAAARRLVGLHAAIAAEHGVHLPEMDLGGGYGIAYTSEHDPLEPVELATRLAGIMRHEMAAVGGGVSENPPRISVEPGRAIAGPSTFTLYEVGTVKEVELGAGHRRTYVSVDGGMSDNARPALYEADYSCTLANRHSTAEPRLSRVVGRHCESGDIVVLDEYLPADIEPGDLVAVPGTGAYCRSLSSQYNHTPRPPVVAVRGGRSRVVVRRETIDDLLALDVAD